MKFILLLLLTCLFSGVIHMLFGVSLSFFNNTYFKRRLNIITEFIPQVSFIYIGVQTHHMNTQVFYFPYFYLALGINWSKISIFGFYKKYILFYFPKRVVTPFSFSIFIFEISTNFRLPKYSFIIVVWSKLFQVRKVKIFLSPMFFLLH